MPRRIIYIKNPTHGSHFRTLNQDGGGGGRKPPKYRRYTNKDSPLFKILNIDAWRSKPSGGWASKVKKGKGIPYTPGIFIGTGGARYKMPGSEWFIFKPPPAPLWSGFVPEGTIGTPAYETPVTQFLYDKFGSVDKHAMGIQTPYGTPGTLKGPDFISLGGQNPGVFGDKGFSTNSFFREQMAAKSTWWGGYIHEEFVPFTGKETPVSGRLPSGYTVLDPNRFDEPSAIIKAWQAGQDQRLNLDFSQAGWLSPSQADYLHSYTNWIGDSAAVQDAASITLFGTVGRERHQNFWLKALSIP